MGEFRLPFRVDLLQALRDRWSGRTAMAGMAAAASRRLTEVAAGESG